VQLQLKPGPALVHQLSAVTISVRRSPARPHLNSPTSRLVPPSSPAGRPTDLPPSSCAAFPVGCHFPAGRCFGGAGGGGAWGGIWSLSISNYRPSGKPQAGVRLLRALLGASLPHCCVVL